MKNTFDYIDCLTKVLLITHLLLTHDFRIMKIIFRVTQEASILAFYSILRTTHIKRNNENIVKLMSMKNGSQTVPCPYIKEGISQLNVKCLFGPEPQNLLVLHLLTAATQSTMLASLL